jgi:hypothetical protein
MPGVGHSFKSRRKYHQVNITPFAGRTVGVRAIEYGFLNAKFTPYVGMYRSICSKSALVEITVSIAALTLGVSKMEGSNRQLISAKPY